MKNRLIASILMIMLVGSISFITFNIIRIDATNENGDCDSSYPDVCIPSPPPDLNCGDIPDKGFTVLSPDPHGFDHDGDGIGCDS